MKKNTENTDTAKTTETRTLKKVSATQIKLADQKPGFEFEGKYVGTAVRDWVDPQDGEVKPMHTMIIENTQGERTKFLADAGLRMAMEDALIQPGDWFKAVKCDKISIGKGRTMNQWDIYQYAGDN